MLRIVKGPYLQWPTKHSMTIMWETSEEASSRVAYWQTERLHEGLNGRFRTIEESEQVVKVAEPRRIHVVTLAGLAATTTYHYRVSSTSVQGESVQSDEFPLKTAVADDEPFSLAVTSEHGGAGDPESNARVFAQVQRFRPDILLVVGDCVGQGGVYEDWDKCFFGPGKAVLANTPFYLCLGNHERMGDPDGRLEWFRQFVAFPEPRNYYSFDYGNAHIVGLDSTTCGDYQTGRNPRGANPPPLLDSLRPGSAQYEFLVNDLQSSRATWKIVFFHYPPFVSADYQVEGLRFLCPVFEEHGVDLVFNSHTIVYERSHPIKGGKVDAKSGVIYVVAGGAGARPEWFHHKRAWHTAQALAVPHFVQVVVAGPTLRLNAVDAEGRLFDTLSLVK